MSQGSPPLSALHVSVHQARCRFCRFMVCRGIVGRGTDSHRGNCVDSNPVLSCKTLGTFIHTLLFRFSRLYE